MDLTWKLDRCLGEYCRGLTAFVGPSSGLGVFTHLPRTAKSLQGNDREEVSWASMAAQSCCMARSTTPTTITTGGGCIANTSFRELHLGCNWLPDASTWGVTGSRTPQLAPKRAVLSWIVSTTVWCIGPLARRQARSLLVGKAPTPPLAPTTSL